MISTQFRTRVLLVTVLPVITTALILAYIFISGRVDELNKRINYVGNDVSSNLSFMSEYGIISNNFEYLKSTFSHTINKKNIVAIYIKDKNKSIVLKIINDKYKDIILTNIDKNIYKIFTADITKTSISIDDINSVINDSYNANAVIGTVNVVVDLSIAKFLKAQIIKNGIFITVVLTLVTIFIALLFSRSVTKPINQIYSGVNIIKQGSLQYRIPVSFSGELAELANGINNMTSALEVAHFKEIQRKEALINSKNEAEYANKAKSLFLSSMSHEMRTPMNAILGFSQLIELDAKDDVTKGNIQEIIYASEHLLGLIEELFELSEIESGKVRLHIEGHNLKDILEPCLSMVKAAAEKMSIKINNNIDSLPEITVNVDNKRFKQVILNLLTNAIKYNKENGSVTIDCSLEDKKTLFLSITDTGKGINPQYHENIFNYFERAGQECSNIAGSGLGLAISKKLIDKMNGTIGFESTLGEGSRFWVKVPLF